MNKQEEYNEIIENSFGDKIIFFKDDVFIKNDCTGALLALNGFDEFKNNFKQRLVRLSKLTTNRNEILLKLKNIVQEENPKWGGPYSELVALDCLSSFLNITDIKFGNKFNNGKIKDSIAEKNARQEIDIDLSFKFRHEQFYTDVKSLNSVSNELLDKIIKNVETKSKEKVIIGVQDYTDHDFCYINKTLPKEIKKIENLLNIAVINHEKIFKYITKDGKYTYTFSICYGTEIQMLESTFNSYRLAKCDKYKYLNYSDKLLPRDYSFLTFVINPWFNNQLSDFCGMDKTYFRAVSRRTFIEHQKLQESYNSLFNKKNKNNSELTTKKIAENIAGIAFIEDCSIEKKNYLYRLFLYLNPNYKCKKPLTIYDLISLGSESSLTKLVEIDDFVYDNY